MDNHAYVNDPGNRACGCPVTHEPFCDVGRYEREQKLATLIEAAHALTENTWYSKDPGYWTAVDKRSFERFKTALSEV